MESDTRQKVTCSSINNKAAEHMLIPCDERALPDSGITVTDGAEKCVNGKCLHDLSRQDQVLGSVHKVGMVL